MKHHPDPDPRTVTVRCRACGGSLEPFGSEYYRHAKPRCGAWMPHAKERCARYAGHTSLDHRTRYALDNQNHRVAA